MAKSELFSLPFFSFIIKKLGAFAVTRGSRDLKIIDTACNVVKDGKILAMFPEGHRSKSGEILKFKTGVVKIALKSNCKILPCSIFYVKGKFRKKVYLNYGDAFSLKSVVGINFDEKKMNLIDFKMLSEVVRSKVVKMFLEQKLNCVKN